MSGLQDWLPNKTGDNFFGLDRSNPMLRKAPKISFIEKVSKVIHKLRTLFNWYD